MSEYVYLQVIQSNDQLQIFVNSNRVKLFEEDGKLYSAADWRGGTNPYSADEIVSFSFYVHASMFFKYRNWWEMHTEESWKLLI